MIYIKSEKITSPKDLTIVLQLRILLGKSWELCEDIVKVVHIPDHQQDFTPFFSLEINIYICTLTGSRGENIYMKLKLMSMYTTFWT